MHIMGSATLDTPTQGHLGRCANEHVSPPVGLLSLNANLRRPVRPRTPLQHLNGQKRSLSFDNRSLSNFTQMKRYR
jgi:hypothetical protein